MDYSINIKKRILSFFMVIIISTMMILSHPLRTKAVIPEVVIGVLGVLAACVIGAEQIGGEDYEQFYRETIKPNWQQMVGQGLGYLGGKPVDMNKYFPHIGPDPIQEWKLWMAERNGTTADNISDEDLYRTVYNMFNDSSVNYDNDSISISSDLNSLLHFMDRQYTNYVGSYYVYPYSIDASYGIFSDGTYYQALRNKIREIENEGNYLILQHSVLNSSGHGSIAAFPYENDIVSLPYGNDVNYNGSTYQLFNQDNWGIYSFGANSYRNFTYDSSTGSFIETDTNNGWTDVRGVTGAASLLNNQPYRRQAQGMWSIFLSSRRNYGIKVYKTLADLKAGSVGYNAYYTNNSVYNDWSSSTGDYTVTTSNYNPVSYGDITNYIDSFNTENGGYPNLPDINNFIENFIPEGTNPTPTPNPDNPSGGGGSSNATATANNEGIHITVNNNHNINFGGSSLSGNTVSGNGTGGSGTIGNIFDWLGHLGQVIGNFIKSAGEMIVEVIQGISEAVTGILETIPNIFTPLIEFVFGGLPEEVQHLITLGMTCILLVGVIQMIRK